MNEFTKTQDFSVELKFISIYFSIATFPLGYLYLVGQSNYFEAPLIFFEHSFKAIIECLGIVTTVTLAMFGIIFVFFKIFENYKLGPVRKELDELKETSVTNISSIEATRARIFKVIENLEATAHVSGKTEQIDKMLAEARDLLAENTEIKRKEENLNGKISNVSDKAQQLGQSIIRTSIVFLVHLIVSIWLFNQARQMPASIETLVYIAILAAFIISPFVVGLPFAQIRLNSFANHSDFLKLAVYYINVAVVVSPNAGALAALSSPELRIEYGENQTALVKSFGKYFVDSKTKDLIPIEEARKISRKETDLMPKKAIDTNSDFIVCLQKSIADSNTCSRNEDRNLHKLSR